jgi:hypothetical protein
MWSSFAWPKKPTGAPAADTAATTASDWVLGRSSMLLQPRNPITDAHYTSLFYNAFATLPRGNGYAPGPWLIQDSRFDVVTTTMEQFRDDLDAELQVRAALPPGGGPVPEANQTWYQSDATASINYARATKAFADRADQTGMIKPTDELSSEMALATPIFLKGSTQFIVEFAGDFYDQGFVALGGDGVPHSETLGTIDWETVPPAAGGGTRIRWYGMPRNVDGDAAGTPDVQPLSVAPPDFDPGAGVRPWWNDGAVQRAHANATDPYIFAWGPVGTQDIRPRPIGYRPADAATGKAAIGAKQGHAYACRPRLIRIIIEATDQNSRLPEGQHIEMIFRLPDLVRKF